MASHSQFQRRIAEVLFHILDCKFLPLRTGHVREIEILLPADQSLIGAAKCHIDRSVLKLKLDSRHLRLGTLAHKIDITAHLRVSKPLTLCGRPEQERGKLGKALSLSYFLYGMNFPVSAADVFDRHRIIPGFEDYAVIVHVSQLSQDQIIHIIERILVKSQITSPFEVFVHIIFFFHGLFLPNEKAFRKNIKPVCVKTVFPVSINQV